MKTPEWLQPALYGFGAGAVALSIVGFTAFGWVTGGTATAQADSASKTAVLAALTPVCLERARLDPEGESTIAKILQASSTQRRNLLMETGWATMPGEARPNRELADACHRALSTI